jgi:bifunctional non-homologous end joining protein LigD
LVGYYEGEAFRFAGKVGTGFDEKLLKSLYRRMESLRRDTCPFTDLPEKSGGKWTQNITPAVMRRCHWIDPQLVCQVKFTEWTRDGKLRHPVFMGMREDKAAREVIRERPTTP